jgi:hypothetical protein
MLAETLKTFNIIHVLFPRADNEAYIKLEPGKPKDKN